MKALVYIAGSISGPDLLANVRRGVEVYVKMIDDGVVTPFCPHLDMLVSLMLEGHAAVDDYDYWLERDFDVLSHCHALYRMEGESVGADREVHYVRAGRSGRGSIPVFTQLDALYAWAERMSKPRKTLSLDSAVVMNPDGGF